MAFTTLLRHLANLVSPGMIWLSAFLGFVRFHDYPVWRPEILLIGLALIALGFPFGLLIAIRAKTLGAAATNLLLLGWAAENLLTRYPDSFTT
jgi:threonine/homoserine/homoserine lactone efflux protein